MVKDVARPPLKRFYTLVSVKPKEDHFAVYLDDRELKTPGKATVQLRNEALAIKIADEWDAQEEHIVPGSMPLTQLICTAVDRITQNRSEIEGLIANYIETDLVCHRVETPIDLAMRQNDAWQPFVDWVQSFYDVNVPVTTSILPMPVDPDVTARIRHVLAQFDDCELAAISVMTQAMGSVILALAIAEGEVDATSAAKASQLDERYQRDLWGSDREDEQRLTNLVADVVSAADFLALHRG